MHRLAAVFALAIALPSCRCTDDKPARPEPCRGDVGPFTGEATHYDADGTGNCSFDASPNDLMVAAMNGSDYANASWCGACVTVVGPRGEVTVRIVDSCPGCARGDLDLSREAFAKIAALGTGRVPITWRPAPCDVSGPVAYKFKGGSNAFWTAIQVRNHRYAISELEVGNADGAYRAIRRVDYNYFVDANGLGDKPLAIRVTDTRANVVEDVGIAPGDDVVRQGAAQFRLCP